MPTHEDNQDFFFHFLILALPLLAFLLFVPSETSVAASLSSSTKFKNGDVVQTTTSVNVYQTPGSSGTVTKSEPAGTQGIIIGAPTYADGSWWWPVAYYADNIIGWSAEDYLQKTQTSSSSAPALTPAPTPPAPPVTACTQDVKSCSDGSFVSRIPPTCQFATCPTPSAPPPSTTPAISVSPTAPVMTLITPWFGSVGTKITIEGKNFTPTENDVHFGSGGFKNVSSSNGKLTFTIPADIDPCVFWSGTGACTLPTHKAFLGAYSVYVANANGQSTPGNVTIVVPQPHIDFIAPQTAPPGTKVVLKGYNFTASNDISITSLISTSTPIGFAIVSNVPSQNSGTEILFTFPSTLASHCTKTTPALCSASSFPTPYGDYFVTVTNSNGTSSPALFIASTTISFITSVPATNIPTDQTPTQLDANNTAVGAIINPDGTTNAGAVGVSVISAIISAGLSPLGPTGLLIGAAAQATMMFLGLDQTEFMNTVGLNALVGAQAGANTGGVFNQLMGFLQGAMAGLVSATVGGGVQALVIPWVTNVITVISGSSGVVIPHNAQVAQSVVAPAETALADATKAAGSKDIDATIKAAGKVIGYAVTASLLDPGSPSAVSTKDAADKAIALLDSFDASVSAQWVQEHIQVTDTVPSGGGEPSSDSSAGGIAGAAATASAIAMGDPAALTALSTPIGDIGQFSFGPQIGAITLGVVGNHTFSIGPIGLSIGIHGINTGIPGLSYSGPAIGMAGPLVAVAIVTGLVQAITTISELLGFRTDSFFGQNTAITIAQDISLALSFNLAMAVTNIALAQGFTQSQAQAIAAATPGVTQTAALAAIAALNLNDETLATVAINAFSTVTAANVTLANAVAISQAGIAAAAASAACGGCSVSITSLTAEQTMQALAQGITFGTTFNCGSCPNGIVTNTPPTSCAGCSIDAMASFNFNNNIPDSQRAPRGGADEADASASATAEASASASAQGSVAPDGSAGTGTASGGDAAGGDAGD